MGVISLRRTRLWIFARRLRTCFRQPKNIEVQKWGHTKTIKALWNSYTGIYPLVALCRWVNFQFRFDPFLWFFVIFAPVFPSFQFPFMDLSGQTISVSNWWQTLTVSDRSQALLKTCRRQDLPPGFYDCWVQAHLSARWCAAGGFQ